MVKSGKELHLMNEFNKSFDELKDYVPQVYGCYFTLSTDKTDQKHFDVLNIYLFTESMDKNLEDFRVTPNNRIYIYNKVFRMLSDLNIRKIIHNDIKP